MQFTPNLPCFYEFILLCYVHSPAEMQRENKNTIEAERKGTRGENKGRFRFLILFRLFWYGQGNSKATLIK